MALKMKGFYSRKEVVPVELEERQIHRFAVDGVFGGRTMGAVRFSVFPLAGRWFIGAGAGFTGVCADPLLVNLPLSFRTGFYWLANRPARARLM